MYHNPEQLEPRFSFQQDVDGYTLYNFTRNTSPFSSISKDHPLVPVVKKTNSTNLFSGNFEPNSSRVGVGNLIKIIYPTKGYSSIEYSPHLGSKKERVWTTSGGTFHLRRGCKDPREVKGELEITMDANSTTLEVTAYGSVDYYACAQNGIPSKDFHDRLFFSVYDIAAQKYIYSTSRAINDGIDQSTESCLKYGTNCPINVVPGKKYRIEYQVTSYFNQVLGVFSISYNGKYVDKIIPNVVIAGGSKVSSVIDYDQDGTITSKKEYFYSKVSNLSKTDNSIINRSKGNYYSVVKTFPLCITSQEDSNGYMWMYSGSKTDVNRHTIHEKSITNDYLTVGNSIYFGTITEKVDNISYRERNFEITSTVPPLAIIDTQLPNVPYENQQVENYLLKSEINYKIKPNGGYAKVNETINNYLKVSPAKARLKSQVIVENFTMPSNIVLGPYALEPYSLTEYVNSLVFNVLSKVDEIQYDENGALAVKKTIVNSYKDNNLSSSVTSFSNSSDKYTSQYFYAKDKNLANLINLNVVGVPVEIKTILNGSLLERELFTFENYVYPTNYKIFGKDNISLKQNSSVFYDKSNGNILEIIRYDGSKEVMLYGYNKSLLICKVLNSSKEEVATALSTTVDKLGLINESNMTSLNALRTKLPNAQVQTYLHNPLIGVTKIIESNGVSSNFEYDPSHRLKAIKDDKGNFVQEFEYNYRM